jgi:hypothetical protein
MHHWEVRKDLPPVIKTICLLQSSLDGASSHDDRLV